MHHLFFSRMVAVATLYYSIYSVKLPTQQNVLALKADLLNCAFVEPFGNPLCHQHFTRYMKLVALKARIVYTKST